MYTLEITFANVPKNIFLFIFGENLLCLILLILGIRTINILMKKLTKFSTFEKQLLSLLILKCVYTIVAFAAVS